MVLRAATSLLGALEGGRPSLGSYHFKAQKSLDFQGPPLPIPLDVARLKTITYRAIKTKGTLIVIIHFSS
jgi:hypothetical protein